MRALERLVGSIVAAVIQFPIICCILLACATAASVWQLQHLSFDSSAENFLKDDDPQRLQYLKFENQYGLSAYFIVLVRDPALFTEAGVARLQNLHQQLERDVSNIARVESLVNARFISSEDDDILIEEFLNSPDLSAQAIVHKREQALTTPYYVGRLINPTADGTALLLQMSQYDEHGQRMSIQRIQTSVNEINRVLKANQPHYSEALLLGGSPVIGAELTKTTQQEMLMFSALAALVVAIMLYAVFRCWSAVVLPLICLFASIAMVLSIMAALDYSVQVSSIILPSFLMAVGVADAVHFLRAFYPELNKTHDMKVAIMYAIDHTATAMFFTTLTTSVGLLSFAGSSITSIASFGIFSAVGVWMAFGLTVIGLPAMLVLLPLKPRQQAIDSTRSYLHTFTESYVLWLNRYASLVCAAGAALLIICMALASQLQFSLNMLEWFKSDHSVRIANEQIEQEMSGSMQLELLIRRTDQSAQALDITHLQMIDQWLNQQHIVNPAGVPISSSVSVLNLLKEANAVLQPEVGYQLPDSSALLAQQLLILQFDPNNTLSKLMDNGMREIRLTLSIPWQDSLQYNRFVDALDKSFSSQTEGLAMEATGMATLSNQAFEDMTHSMLESYFWAGLSILILLMLLTRKAGLGLLAMILPNVLPVCMVLALMHLLAIPLDMFTMLIGSIAIGLIVDDTIHLLYSFQRNVKEGLAPIDAMINSLLTTGKALVATTVVLSFAFLIYCLSSLSNLMAFGYLTALCIMFALVADLLLLPAILLLLYKNNKDLTYV